MVVYRRCVVDTGNVGLAVFDIGRRLTGFIRTFGGRVLMKGRWNLAVSSGDLVPRITESVTGRLRAVINWGVGVGNGDSDVSGICTCDGRVRACVRLVLQSQVDRHANVGREETFERCVKVCRGVVWRREGSGRGQVEEEGGRQGEGR